MAPRQKGGTNQDHVRWWFDEGIHSPSSSMSVYAKATKQQKGSREYVSTSCNGFLQCAGRDCRDRMYHS